MAASMQENAESEDRAYYAVLMVDFKATTADIKHAYKKLSLQFHPDKHNNPESKQAAEKIFNRITRARDVLADPHRRAIYDAVGLKGLQEFEKGQLVQKDMRSTKEIIEEYERLIKVKQFMEEMQSFDPHSFTEVGVDLCSLFDRKYFIEDDEADITDIIGNFEIPHIRLQQGMTVPIHEKFSVSLNAHSHLDFLGKRNNNTMGYVCGKCRKQGLPLDITGEISLSFGNDPEIGTSLHKILSKYSTLSMNGNLNFIDDAVLMSWGPVFSTQLSKHLWADLHASTGGISEVVRCGARYMSNTVTVHVNVQVGRAFPTQQNPCLVSFAITKSLPDHNLKLKFAAMRSFTTWNLHCGFTKSLPTQQASIAAVLHIGSNKGVSLAVTVRRGRQKLRVPIQMSYDIQPMASIYGLLIPVMAYAAVNALVVIPYLKKKRESARLKKKEEEKERLAQRRLDAIDEVTLMTHAVTASIAQEEAKGGLVIVKALYGKLATDGGSSGDLGDDQVINVSIPLQHQVKDSALRVPGEVSKVDMPGFYDTCFGEEKSLYIRYKFHNTLHHVTISENEPISIPKQGHVITNPS